MLSFCLVKIAMSLLHGVYLADQPFLVDRSVHKWNALKNSKNKWCEVFFRHILTYQAGTVSQNQKLEVIVQCLTWLVQFWGKKLIFTSKVWHIHPTSSPCCTARIATKLFPVHCHMINIKTLKYHFPTVCTWGVMQLLVNPIWSTILGLSPAQRRVKLQSDWNNSSFLTHRCT